MFLAYNNGLSITVEEIATVELPDGGVGLTSVTGMQIVNGGQTTASVFAAFRENPEAVEHIRIPAKIIRSSHEMMNEIAPLISRYSNSQNAVKDTDFSANDPFHWKIQDLSRRIWAPAGDGSQRQTHWFYERARGQYRTEKAATSRKSEFERENPQSQQFNKTHLARYQHLWEQKPHIVSLGAENNFRLFTKELQGREETQGLFEPDEQYFRDLISKAILVKAVEKIIRPEPFGYGSGLTSFVANYSVAYLSYVTARSFGFEKIWQDQMVSESLHGRILDVCRNVYDVMNTSRGQMLFSMWARKAECWEVVRALDKKIGSGDFADYAQEQGYVTTEKDPISGDVVMHISNVPAFTWYQISKWGKETEHIKSWERSLAYSLGRLRDQGREPSLKQAQQGARILVESEKLGFIALAPEEQV